MREIGKTVILSHVELAKSLPRPIRSDAEHERLTASLLALDERDDLSPEEEALAEVLTLLIEDHEEKHYPLPSVSTKAPQLKC